MEEQTVVTLSTLKNHVECDTIFSEAKRIKETHFPELAEQIVYLGITGYLRKDGAVANVDVENNVTRFNLYAHISKTVIYHELMHCVQWRNPEMPKTEEYCSIAATARMPAEEVDSNEIAYIVCERKIPVTDFPAACRQALAYAKNGHKNYIQHLKLILSGEIKLNEI